MPIVRHLSEYELASLNKRYAASSVSDQALYEAAAACHRSGSLEACIQALITTIMNHDRGDCPPGCYDSLVQAAIEEITRLNQGGAGLNGNSKSTFSMGKWMSWKRLKKYVKKHLPF